MLRVLGSLGRRNRQVALPPIDPVVWSSLGEAEPENVVVGEADTLEQYSRESYAALGIQDRNTLLARFVASFSGIPESEVVREFEALIGLRDGPSAMVSRINAEWLHDHDDDDVDIALAEALEMALEGELLAASRQAFAADPVAVGVIAKIYGGVSPALAGSVTLRARSVTDLGGCSIGQAIGLAIAKDMEGRAPTWIVGEIRRQAEILTRDIRSWRDLGQKWMLPTLSCEQALRDRIALAVVNQGFIPRLCGSFVVDRRLAWTLGVEMTDPDQLGELVNLLVYILEIGHLDLSVYDSVDLIACNDWSMLFALSFPARRLSGLFYDFAGDSGLVDSATFHETKGPLWKHISQFPTRTR